MSEQIRPRDTLACCWDVKQATNQPTIAAARSDVGGVEVVVHGVAVLRPGSVSAWPGLEGICIRKMRRGRNSSLVVFGLAAHSVAGSILLWGNFPVEGIFSLELTWVQTPFPQKTRSGGEYKPRSSLCITWHFIARTQKDPDIHVLDW